MIKSQTQNSKQFVIDAADQILGRIASRAALILQGKDSPSYDPHLPSDNVVTIKNVSQIKISGNKSSRKIYYRHTGYIGHLREKSYQQIFDKHPERVVQKAVYNMLPKNRLRNNRMKRLKIEI